jgi:hypothetical protein
MCCVASQVQRVPGSFLGGKLIRCLRSGTSETLAVPRRHPVVVRHDLTGFHVVIRHPSRTMTLLYDTTSRPRPQRRKLTWCPQQDRLDRVAAGRCLAHCSPRDGPLCNVSVGLPKHECGLVRDLPSRRRIVASLCPRALSVLVHRGELT